MANDRLEFVAEAGAGDFIFVPPWVPHQEISASTPEPLECALVRSDKGPVVVNLDIAATAGRGLRSQRRPGSERPDPPAPCLRR